MIQRDTISLERRRTNGVGLSQLAKVRADVSSINTSSNDNVPKDAPSKRPRADAPLLPIGRLVTALLHAAVLAGIVGLLVWYILQVPALKGGQAVVSIVAPSLIQVRSPTEGVFIAAAELPAGTQVAQGQLLGHIRAPRLTARTRSVEVRLKTLWRRKLLLEASRAEPTRPELESPVEHEFRECVEKIAAARSELQWLQELAGGLRIVSPIEGRLQYTISGTVAVTTNDPVVHVWPTGGDLLVEVRAPLDTIHDLIRDGSFEARFPTADGMMSVISTPIPGSLTVNSEKEGSGKRRELWGFVQCRPVAIPASIAHPGPVGSL